MPILKKWMRRIGTTAIVSGVAAAIVRYFQKPREARIAIAPEVAQLRERVIKLEAMSLGHRIEMIERALRSIQIGLQEIPRDSSAEGIARHLGPTGHAIEAILDETAKLERLVTESK
jgi:hypothetical protein